MQGSGPRGRDHGRFEGRPSLRFTIIIPCYREHDNLLRNVPMLAQKFPDAEILIIENGSYIAPDLGYLGVRNVALYEKGLGLALRTGIEEAKTSCVVFLPADMSYDLSFVDTAVPIIQHGRAYDLVIGSKGLKESKVARPLLRKAVGLAYNRFYDLLFELKIRDITGVKAYRREKVQPLLERCPSSGVFFEVQLIREMRLREMNILEIPVKVRDYHPSRFVPWQRARA